MNHFIPPIDIGQFQPSAAAISSWLYQIWKYLQENPIISPEEVETDVDSAIIKYMTENPPPVLSVNGQLGNIIIAYNDLVKPSYTLPIYRASSDEVAQSDLLEAWDEGCRFLIVDDETPFMMLRNIVSGNPRIDLIQLAIGGAGHGVTSVNGKTGAVVITYDDLVGPGSNIPIFYTTNDAAGNDELAEAWEAGYRFAVIDNIDPYIIKRDVSPGGAITYSLISIKDSVTSVNGQSGAVTLNIPTKTSDLQNDSGFISGNYVRSVNGHTGAVTVGSTLLLTINRNTWNSATNEVTVIAAGITANSIVWVSPTAESYSIWGQCGIRCIAQGDTSLTFKCDEIPTSNVGVNVVYIN